MICVECGQDIRAEAAYIGGLTVCSDCINRLADTRQAPMPKNVKSDLRLIVTRPIPTVERR